MKPDFAALRAAREEARRRLVAWMADELGSDSRAVLVHFSGGSGCYCVCPDGPCEHEFEGSRDILDSDDDVVGGESFCSLCGMGAMSHSLRCGP